MKVRRRVGKEGDGRREIVGERRGDREYEEIGQEMRKEEG